MNFKRAKGGRKAPLLHHGPVYLACLVVLLKTLSLAAPAFAASPLSGFNPAQMKSDTVATTIGVTAFCADNALSLRALFSNEWTGPYDPDGVNNGDAYWYADAGLVYKGWRIAGFYRGEVFLEADRDTVDIIHMVKTEQDLPVGTDFQIDLDVEGFSASGVEISRKVDLGSLADGLSAGFTARYLYGDRIQHGTVTGVVTPTGPKTYDFNLDVDYVYDENLLYDRDNSWPQSGNGYSFDIGAKYTWQNTVEASLLARDLFGRIRWNHAPYTTAEAVSEVIYYNSDGYQEFRPTIRGYEAYRDFTQKIPAKTDLDLAFLAGRMRFGSTVNFIERRPFYWLSAEYSPRDSLTLSLGYNINYHAYSAGIVYKQLQLKVSTDSFSYKKAKEAALTVSCGMEW